MVHYKSIVAYDGTQFKGFQRQGQGERTVQAVLEDGLRKLGWEDESLRAAGRTDAGVHARGQTVAFELDWAHGEEKLTRALNACLPDDVGIRATQTVDEDFDPRFAASSRVYRYRILVDERRDPLRERYAWRVWPSPDVAEMMRACEAVEGEHDFGAFGTPPIAEGHTVRTMVHAECERQADEILVTLEANAFLYRMARRLVGAVEAVGSGRESVAKIVGSLADPDRPWAGNPAPAHGLCLEAVKYGE